MKSSAVLKQKTLNKDFLQVILALVSVENDERGNQKCLGSASFEDGSKKMERCLLAERPYRLKLLPCLNEYYKATLFRPTQTASAKTGGDTCGLAR
jgi:hypothetical protein